jgi:hypothetical protein
MIKLKKQQLAFMDVYQLWANKDQAFELIGKDNVITFSQQSDKGLLVTELEYETKENFQFNFDTDIFVSLIKSLKDETEITVTQAGIEFSGSKYDIKNYDILFEDMSEFITKAKNNSENIIKLSDIDKFQFIKNSIGGEGLNTVSYQSGHFVTSDRINYTSFVKTSFAYEKNFNFSSDLIILLNMMNIKEKDINEYEEFYSCKVNETYILIMKKKYILPDMFDERIMTAYNHPYILEVPKQELKIILDRMKIVAKFNKESRIYLELEKDNLIVKNIDGQLASENINAVIPEEITNIKIPISVNYFSQIISQLNGNTVKCYCTPDIDSFRAMKIEDETQNNFYAINLLEG